MSAPAVKVSAAAQDAHPARVAKRRGVLSALSDSVVFDLIRQLGILGIFFGQLAPRLVPALARPHLIVMQIYNCGARSLSIIMLSGLFVGMVLGLQGFNLLQRFGAESALGILAALGLLTQLGPVVTGLLFAGRAGTSLTSEIGLMRATDQLTAMQMMAVDPLRYVVAPRFLGGLIAVPLLVAIFDLVGLYGAHLIGVTVDGVDRGTYWSQVQANVLLRDAWQSLVKGLVFGFLCTLVAVNEGYHAEPTAAGVGLATTRTVVTSSVLILFFNYVLSAFFL